MLLARPNTRKRHESRSVDRARDELFSAIRQCGVIDALADEQVEWMDDTLQFMKERYPDLTTREIAQLKDLGLRFCQPVIPHGREHTALTGQEPAQEPEETATAA